MCPIHNDYRVIGVRRVKGHVCPPRPPDLNPLNCYLWSDTMSLVYKENINN